MDEILKRRGISKESSESKSKSKNEGGGAKNNFLSLEPEAIKEESFVSQDERSSTC